MTYRDALEEKQNGVQIKLHVTAQCPKTCFPTEYNSWRKSIGIHVQSAAEQNKANKEIIKDLAHFFAISPQQIQIIQGQKNREKIVLLTTINLDFVIQKLHGVFNEK